MLTGFHPCSRPSAVHQIQAKIEAFRRPSREADGLTHPFPQGLYLRKRQSSHDLGTSGVIKHSEPNLIGRNSRSHARRAGAGVHVEAEPPIGSTCAQNSGDRAPPVFLGELSGSLGIPQDALHELAIAVDGAFLEDLLQPRPAVRAMVQTA